MGRRNKALEQQKDSLVRVLVAIEDACKQTGAGTNWLQELSQVASEPLKDNRTQKSRQQAWRRWTKGINLPPKAKAARIVKHAQESGWPVKIDERDQSLVQDLLAAANRVQAPRPWGGGPLGCYQPTQSTERAVWMRRLTRIRIEVALAALTEMEAEIQKETKGAVETSLCEPPHDFVMALFRATLNEVACSMIEFMCDRPEVQMRKQGGPSFFSFGTDNWPGLLRATGDDVTAMLYAVAHEVATSGNPASAASRMRARMLERPDTSASRNDPKRPNDF